MTRRYKLYQETERGPSMSEIGLVELINLATSDDEIETFASLKLGDQHAFVYVMMSMSVERIE